MSRLPSSRRAELTGDKHAPKQGSERQLASSSLFVVQVYLRKVTIDFIFHVPVIMRNFRLFSTSSKITLQHANEA